MMKIGLLTTSDGSSASPAQLARKMEELGFESIWFPDHPVLPVHADTPLPESRPGEGATPEVYGRMCDQFVAMGMAAMVTTRLKLATGISLVPERHPLIAANQIATLDVFSGGRVILGVGSGWLREESEILGVDFPHRWTQTKEFVAAMRQLWTKEEASFEGKYVKFPPLRCNPKPAQKAGPPVLLGSKDKNSLRWVARWGDGWCPLFLTPAQLKVELERLRKECEATGRDYKRLDITIVRREFRGDRAQVQEGLAQYAAAGANRIVLLELYPLFGPDNYESALTKLASLYI
jgi:probable F420-dependent oxidoreductase